MKSRYILLALCVLCASRMASAQSSNSTSVTGGFMNQVNSWLSRLRGTHHQQNSDKNKEKEEKEKLHQRPHHMGPPYPGMVPYPMMSGLYGPMNPLSSMAFAQRPITGAIVPQPFGSIAAGSSIGPNFGVAPNSYGSIDQSSFGVGSASHMLPVQHPDFAHPDIDYGQAVGHGLSGAYGGGFGSYSAQPLDHHHMGDHGYHHGHSGDSGHDDYQGYQR